MNFFIIFVLKNNIDMGTVSYTELRNNLKSYLDTVVANMDPLIVHRPSNKSVVVISLDEYNAIKETEYIASSPEMMRRLRSAEQNMKAGKGLKIDIDTL
jgi:antitoxin YefM